MRAREDGSVTPPRPAAGLMGATARKDWSEFMAWCWGEQFEFGGRLGSLGIKYGLGLRLDSKISSHAWFFFFYVIFFFFDVRVTLVNCVEAANANMLWIIS